MSDEVITRIVIALSTLSGSLIVALLALKGARLQHERSIDAEVRKENRARTAAVEKESRERTAALDKEARDRVVEGERSARRREEEAAVELDRLFSQFGRDQADDLAERRARDYDDLSKKERQLRKERLLDAQDAVGAQAAFLPESYRLRLLLLRDVIRWADELGADASYGGGWHFHGAHSLIRGAVEEAHQLIAAFLRHQDSPPGSKRYEQYALIVRALRQDKELEFAQEIHEEDEAKQAWLRRFPEGGHLL